MQPEATVQEAGPLRGGQEKCEPAPLSCVLAPAHTWPLPPWEALSKNAFLPLAARAIYCLYDITF